MLRQIIKLNNLQNYIFNAHIGKKYLHGTTPRFVTEKTEELENKHIGNVNSTLNKYDHKQAEKILKIINNYNLNDLLGYEISKTRANKLLAWRARFGLIKSLHDVFNIEGFGQKVTDKFFQSLLLEPKEKDVKLTKGQTTAAPFITPVLIAEQKQTIKATVSVRIGVNSITWSRLDVPAQDINATCLLTHWQHHEISEKKLHLHELIQRCLYVNHLIPAADCYLFENPQIAQASNNPGSVEQKNINIQKAQVTAIMGYALASRKTRLYEGIDNVNDIYKTNILPNVFYMRRFLSSRLFNRLVGTERVSSEETILNMMRTNTEDKKYFLPPEQEQTSDVVCQVHDSIENFSGRVQFPMELREMFSIAPRYYREFLGQSLLLNLAFVRLVLLQDAESIAKVSRGGNKATLT